MSGSGRRNGAAAAALAELLEEPCEICQQPAGEECVSIADGKPIRTHHTRGSRQARRRALNAVVDAAAASATSHSDTTTAAAALLQLATNVWRDNIELEQQAWASMIGHVRLEGAHAGVDVDGRLVLVAPHRCQDDLVPVLQRELQRLADELWISVVAVAAVRPVPPLPGHEGGTIDELLEDLAAAPTEFFEHRTRAHGSFTLEIPVHDRLEDYAELVDAIERGMWAVAAAIDEAKESSR